MDQSETLTHLPPGVSKEEAVESLAEMGMDSVSVQFESRFTARQFLYLYEYGRARMKAKHLARWREAFSIGLATGGLFAGIGVVNGEPLHEEPGVFAVFWRTHSPNVRIDLRMPEYAEDGACVYVCWMWNEMGLMGMRAFRNHLRATQTGAQRLAHHDQRKKSKKRGRLIDVPLYPGVNEDALRVLAERNGHGK